LLKRLGPNVHHLLWVTALLLAVTTPALPLLRTIVPEGGFHRIAQKHSFMISVAAKLDRPVSESLVLPPTLVLTLFFLFLTTLAWFAIRLSWSLHYTIKIRREARPLSLGPVGEELWRHCKEVFSVKEAEVLRSERIAGPVTIGFTRPALIVSGGFIEKCGSLEVLAALAHECAHMKRRDFQKNLLYEIASLAIAYHPVTWFVKSQIERTREMICDDMATENVIDRRSYAESLLRLAKVISLNAGALAFNAIGIFDANVLEERIMMIKTKKHHFSSSIKYGVTAGSILLLFSVAAGIGAMAWPIEAQSQAGSSNSASAKGRNHVDLSCTYYEKGIGRDGTCETHKDKTYYFCSPNDDRKLSQEQVGCEWKIQRAKALGVKGLER
jgi:beta-lactamase regulating signal transducer with metallopeptidase domain